MKNLDALMAGVICATFWTPPATAGGPVMPCDTGGTLHLTSKTTTECSGNDCPKIAAVSTIRKDESRKK